jgi:hypothetical protein
MNSRGFSFVELLVAAALALLVAGALFTTAAPMKAIISRSLEGAHLEAGARAALDQVVADVREAGSDASIAPPDTRLVAVVSPLEILENLDSAPVGPPGAAVRVRRIPSGAAQGRLRAPAFVGDTILRLDVTSNCLSGPPSCGFDAGTAVLFTSTISTLVSIAATAQESAILSAPLTSAFPPGAVLSELLTTSYGLRPVPGAGARLVRITTNGAEQPLLDDVVLFEVDADDADLTRARRISLRLRVEAGLAYLRGPAGYLFTRAGTATSATQWLPDAELGADVALRNVRGGW